MKKEELWATDRVTVAPLSERVVAAISVLDMRPHVSGIIKHLPRALRVGVRRL